MHQLSILFTVLLLIGPGICAIQRSTKELQTLESVKKLTDEIRTHKEGSVINLLILSPDNLLQSIFEAQKTLNLTRSLIRKVKNISYEDFDDQLFRRRLDRIKYLPYILEDDDFLRYLDAQIHLRNTLTNRNVCSFKDQTKCTLSYVTDIKDIVSKSRNREELLYYWKEWRDKNEEEIKTNFGEFVEVTRKMAVLHERNPASSEVYYLYDDNNFHDELKNVIKEVEPLYKELHAYVRRTIKNVFGNESISPEGIIPHHLLEPALQYLRTENTEYKRLDDLIKEKELIPQEALNITVDFFKHIQVPQFTEKLWSNYTRVRPIGTSDDFCKSEVTGLFFTLCPKVDGEIFFDLYKNIADTQYLQHIANLEYGFNEDPCPGFAEAVSKAIKLSASSPKYFKKIDFLKDFQTNDDFTTGFLLNNALDSLFKLQIHFVNQMFKVDVLDGKIKPTEWNSAYWKIMKKYAGISSPFPDRNENSDFDNLFFEEFSIDSSVREIFSEIASYQIYQAMCEGIGEVSGTGEGLWNCDFSNSSTVGKVLRETMSLGAEKSWFDILEALVGDVNLNASPLLVYFKPLVTKLQEENKNKAEIPGWTQ